MVLDKSKIGTLVTIGVVLSPILFWLVEKPIGLRFSTLSSVSTSLGQLTGILGMTFFALALIFNARLKFLGSFSIELNRLSFGRIAGYLALIFLLFHPLLLAVRYLLFSFDSAARFLLPTLQDLPRSFGILSLGFMIILFLLSSGAIRRICNKLWGVVFCIAVAHLFLVSSDISRSLPLKIYFILLSSLAILSCICQLLPKPKTGEAR